MIYSLTILNFIKKNWKPIVGFIVGFVFCLGLMQLANCGGEDDYQSLFNKYKQQSKDFNKQIQELQELYKQERLKKQKIKEEYETKIKEIKEKHSKKLKDLEKNKIQKQKDIIKETGDDPTKMAIKLNQFFGLPIYIPPPEYGP